MGILRALVPAFRAAFTGGSLPWESPRGGLSVQAPGVTTAPVVAGTNAVGSTLTCTPGVYTGAPAPTVTRQWKRAGVAITNETALTYVQVTADAGAALTCVETATNAVNSTTSTSNTITTKPYNTALPSIDNTLYAGGSIAMTDAVWSGATSQVRDVLVDGVVVVDDASEATVEAYVILLASEGLSCVVRSIATGPGGTTSADSAGVTIWSPALASNLAHWYRGDSVVTASGDLQTMTDKVVSGGVNATQGTAAQRPAYSASLPILGQPGGVYAGPAVDWLDTGAISSIPQPFSIALAAAITSDPTIQQELCGSTTGWWLDVYLGQLRVFGGTAAIDTGFYPAQNQTFRAVITINGTSTRVRVDGSLVYSGATNAGSGAAARCMIGRAAVGIYWRGEIGEVTLLSGNLIADTAELAHFEGYLSARYT